MLTDGGFVGSCLMEASGFWGLSRRVLACDLAFCIALGGIPALRAHSALLLDYVPPEHPPGTPLGNTLRIRPPKLDWRDLEGDFPGSCGSGEGPGASGGNLTVCWAVKMEGSEVVNLNLGWQRRWTPSCIADSPLSTHHGSIPSGGVRLQPSQPPWQEVAGHWSGYRTPYPQ